MYRYDASTCLVKTMKYSERSDQKPNVTRMLPDWDMVAMQRNIITHLKWDTTNYDLSQYTQQKRIQTSRLPPIKIRLIVSFKL